IRDSGTTLEYVPWYHGVLLHRLRIPRAAYDFGVRHPPVGPPSGGEGGDDSDDNDDEGGTNAHQHVRDR
ncbi:hypothetical protein KI387_006613, partial [Taxus chinensis]